MKANGKWYTSNATIHKLQREHQSNIAKIFEQLSDLEARIVALVIMRFIIEKIEQNLEKYE